MCRWRVGSRALNGTTDWEDNVLCFIDIHATAQQSIAAKLMRDSPSNSRRRGRKVVIGVYQNAEVLVGSRKSSKTY